MDDPVDLAILAEVSRDPRATLAQLSEHVGLGVSAVQARLRRLESTRRHRRLPGAPRPRGRRQVAVGVHRDHAARSLAARQRPRAARAPRGHRGLPLDRGRRELHPLRAGRDAAGPRGAHPRHPPRRHPSARARRSCCRRSTRTGRSRSTPDRDLDSPTRLPRRRDCGYAPASLAAQLPVSRSMARRDAAAQSCWGKPRFRPPCDGSSQRRVTAFSCVKKSNPCGP